MRVTVLIVLLVAVLAIPTGAQTITLKNSFFSGWKYSTNGTTYHRVGVTGNDLALYMEGKGEAVKEMTSYKNNKVAALITGCPGGFLLGWPLGASIGGGEWKDDYNTMLVVGGALSIVSIVLEITATNRLKKAVAIYNGEDTGLKLGFRPGLLALSDPQTHGNKNTLIPGGTITINF